MSTKIHSEQNEQVPLTDLSIDSYRSVNNGVHSQDGRLGRVNDRSAHHGAKHSAIGDGERSSVHVFDC